MSVSQLILLAISSEFKVAPLLSFCALRSNIRKSQLPFNVIFNFVKSGIDAQSS